MRIVKYTPLFLFLGFIIQSMFLKQFTYQVGLISLVLGLVAFGFSFFDTRHDMKKMREEFEQYKKDNSKEIEEIKQDIVNTSSVLNAVKVQNNISSRRF